MILRFMILIFVFVLCLSFEVAAQKTDTEKTSATASITVAILPKVTQINEIALKNLLKPNGKPLLVNFWATWCVPCVEEFPDLVKINDDYKAKIDFITVSMDDLAEINRDVPKFLSEMKAEMPAYLLRTQNEDATIMMVSKNWQGGLPFTILFNEKGETVYFRQGKVKIDILRAQLNKLPIAEKTDETVVLMDFVKIINGNREEALFFYENNWKVYREIALKRGSIKSYEIVEIAPTANNQFDLILITRYAGEEQFKNSEKNFEPILKETRPNGPVLKNELKPEDFRQNVFMNVGKPVVASEN